MSIILKKYLSSVGKYIAAYIGILFLLAVIALFSNKGADINSTDLATTISNLFTVLDMFVFTLFILIYLSIFNYKMGKEFGLKNIIGLPIWLLIFLPLLYNYFGRVSSDVLFTLVFSKFLAILLSSITIFIGNTKRSREDANFAKKP